MTDEDRELEARAAARIASQTPSNIAPPHCWFCGKLEAWFACDCRDARDAQAGKRAKPRVAFRDRKTLIVLDREVMDREHNQKRPRATPPVSNPVSTEPVSTAPAGAVSSPPVSTEEARRAYQRDLMRRRRAAAKGGSDGDNLP